MSEGEGAVDLTGRPGMLILPGLPGAGSTGSPGHTDYDLTAS
jgi:hypothetical protein